MSGAAIDKMNIVRRSLSQIKGGRLAEAIYPAQMTTYMISDIPGDDPASYWFWTNYSSNR